MRYMLLIHAEDEAPAAAASPARFALSPGFAAFMEAMTKAGVYLGGERLRPGASAASVRLRDGRRQVLDGPYADTKEQFAGYCLIDVPSLDEAVEWAARCPGAERGTVEVRAVWETTAPE